MNAYNLLNKLDDCERERWEPDGWKDSSGTVQQITEILSFTEVLLKLIYFLNL